MSKSIQRHANECGLLTMNQVYTDYKGQLNRFMWQSILYTTKPPIRKNNYASQSRYISEKRGEI